MKRMARRHGPVKLSPAAAQVHAPRCRTTIPSKTSAAGVRAARGRRTPSMRSRPANGLVVGAAVVVPVAFLRALAWLPRQVAVAPVRRTSSSGARWQWCWRWRCRRRVPGFADRRVVHAAVAELMASRVALAEMMGVVVAAAPQRAAFVGSLRQGPRRWRSWTRGILRMPIDALARCGRRRCLVRHWPRWWRVGVRVWVQGLRRVGLHQQEVASPSSRGCVRIAQVSPLEACVGAPGVWHVPRAVSWVLLPRFGVAAERGGQHAAVVLEQAAERFPDLLDVVRNVTATDHLAVLGPVMDQAHDAGCRVFPLRPVAARREAEPNVGVALAATTAVSDQVLVRL
mmetsp:Transcript_97416/g.275495  ORF Transcript_97416/g.275495 Transcript_97416/m.275495 type:complete len:342 (+) Transcript_97416:44-1069(+)